MQSLRNIHCVTAMVILLCISGSQGLGRDDKYPADVQKIIDGIMAAKYPHERVLDEGANFKSLFNKVGPDGLKRLKNHPDTSIALQAAWELVELTTPLEIQGPSQKVDCKTIEEFVAFLENRCDIKCPEWWRSSLLQANVNRRYNIWMKGPEPDLYHRTGIDSLMCPRNTSVAVSGKDFKLHVADHSMIIPGSLFKRTDNGRIVDNLCAYFTSDRCYMTIHGDWGYPHSLVCLERRSGKVLWESKVWGSWWFGGGGDSRGWVALTEQGNRIVLFGKSVGFNVEAFDIKDGKNLFRFSNSYR